MESLRELYRIGKGPSSSHTMGPDKAAKLFKDKYPFAASFKVKLFGSLSKTGKGHMTDAVILTALAPIKTDIIFMDTPESELYHPNTMELEAYDINEKLLGI